MNVEATLYYKPDGDDDVQEVTDGQVLVELDDGTIFVHFRVNGDTIATAALDLFNAGFLTGNIQAAATASLEEAAS